MTATPCPICTHPMVDHVYQVNGTVICSCGCTTTAVDRSMRTVSSVIDEDTGGATPIEIPDGIEPLVGYRGWSLNEAGLLTGAVHMEPWPPGGVEAAASCAGRPPTVEVVLSDIAESELDVLRPRIQEVLNLWLLEYRDPHEPPNESCSCGLYARLDRDEITHGQVEGRVKAWGKIVKGAYGFRAQYAQVTGLYLGLRHGQVFDQLEKRIAFIGPIAERYQVPILDMPEERRRTPLRDIADPDRPVATKELPDGRTQFVDIGKDLDWFMRRFKR